MTVRTAPLDPPAGLVRGLRATAVLCGLVFLVGLFVSPQRAWGGYLIGFVYFAGLALAGALFLSLVTLAGARWAAAFRRVPEAMTAALPAAAVLGVVLLGGVHSLYEWSHESAVAEDPLLAHKSGYLNRAFFALRLAVFFGLWIWLARRMVAAQGRRRFLWAALFLPTFAVTFSLASVDWLQSLEPHWFSTIYGLVTLSGLATSGLAACLILAIWLRRGPLRGVVRDEHLDDLGRIGIGLALFWGYVWYCQYMLIWYTNMPEETPYYALRAQGDWRTLTWLSLALNWAIPFCALMPRAVRRSETLLLRVAWVMLAGQAVHLFLLVEPGLMGVDVVFGVWEVAPLVGALALFVLVTLRGLARATWDASDDPDLLESLSYRT